MNKRYWLTPKSPTGATSIDLGTSRDEAKTAMLELGYSLTQALDALGGGVLPSVSDGQDDEWTVEVTK